MYGIIVKNTGMWGFSTWCKRDGKTELYNTKEEAEKVAHERNENQGCINCFNHYYVEKYD